MQTNTYLNQILTKYFVFFVPILLAFALVFRAAMPTQFANGNDDNSDEFTNMLYSLVKIIAMMVGEYDFSCETFNIKINMTIIKI